MGEGSERVVGKSRKSEDFSKEEKLCRICHLGTDDNSKKVEIVPLGCDCKGGIGSSHLHCAETWFSQKGNRLCEICGKMVKNIKRNREEILIPMMERNDIGLAAETLEPSRESMGDLKNFFYSTLYVVAFLLLWFFARNKIM